MLSNVHDCVRPRDEAERVFLESLVRDDYTLCHPNETLDDLKHRASFSKEDKGLYRDWLAVAARRAETLSACTPFLVAAE
jgi:hypothetical protein